MDRAVEQEALLRHDRDLLSQRLDRHRAQVVPVDQDATALRVVEPGQQLDDRRLAGPRMANEGHRLAGEHVELESVDDGTLGVVAKAHILEFDGSRQGGQRQRVGGIDEGGGVVHHVKDFVERGRASQERVVDLAQLLDGIEERGEVADKGNQNTNLDRAIDVQVAAVAKHDAGRDGGKKLDGWEVPAARRDGCLVGVAVRLV